MKAVCSHCVKAVLLRDEQFDCIQEQTAEAGDSHHGDGPYDQELHGVLQLGVQAENLSVSVLTRARVLDHMAGQSTLLFEGHLGGDSLLGFLVAQTVSLHESGQLRGWITVDIQNHRIKSRDPSKSGSAFFS